MGKWLIKVTFFIENIDFLGAFYIFIYRNNNLNKNF